MYNLNKNSQRIFLRILFIVTLGVLPFLLKKPPRRDWIIVFVYNAVTNGILDRMIVKRKTVQYPVRPLPKLFKIHVLFDFLVYPTITIIINQLTYKVKPLMIFFKLFYIIIPMLFIELWAERKTDLVKWKKGWEWYHTLASLTAKSLLTRLVIAVIRYVREKKEVARNEKEKNSTKELFS